MKMLSSNMQRIPALLTLGAILLVGACKSGSSEGADRAAAATDALTALRDAGVAVKTEADAASAALKSLLENPQADPKPQFKAFFGKLEALEKGKASYDSRLAKMRSATKTHFDTWKTQNDQITDEDIREKAEDRRADAAEELTKAGKLADEVSAATAPVVSMYKDVHKYLNNQLNPDGIESAKGMVKKAGSLSSDLGEAVDDLSKCIDELVARMKPGSQPAAKPAAGG